MTALACVHHWAVSSPNGTPHLPATCTTCGETRTFPAVPEFTSRAMTVIAIAPRVLRVEGKVTRTVTMAEKAARRARDGRTVATRPLGPRGLSGLQAACLAVVERHPQVMNRDVLHALAPGSGTREGVKSALITLFVRGHLTREMHQVGHAGVWLYSAVAS